MDNYQRQQFDFLLQTAVERFVERLEQRCRGADQALKALRAQPDSELVWLAGFVDAVMAEFLLDNADGASFILRSLARKNVRPNKLFSSESDRNIPVGDVLVAMAKHLLQELILVKAVEALEQHSAYHPVQFGDA